MKALLASAPGVLSLGELETPVPGEYDALVRLDACAFCNSTDHKLLLHDLFTGPLPIALGHESISTVVEVGAKVVNFKPGDRVFRQRLADSHVPGGCSRWGGFAEYALVTDEWARQGKPYGPDALPHDQQKLLLDVAPPLASAMVTLMETLDCAISSGVTPGISFAVVGSGPVGQAFAMFARQLGAGPVYAFGRSAGRAERFARVSGCDGYITGTDFPAEVRRLVDAGGFDLVIEAVGSADALDTALTLGGARGRVCVYGVAPDSNPYRDEQLTRPNVTRVGACEGRAQARMVEMVEQGGVRLEDWVSHVLPMTEYQRALELVTVEKADKVVLVP
ncbi:MAG: zinc-dependent alcohol dehydrogenase [Armatimonadota bacterium]